MAHREYSASSGPEPNAASTRQAELPRPTAAFFKLKFTNSRETGSPYEPNVLWEHFLSLRDNAGVPISVVTAGAMVKANFGVTLRKEFLILGKNIPRTARYDKLLASIVKDHPAVVFLGGDLLPGSPFSSIQSRRPDFVHDCLVSALTRTRDALGVHYPCIFLILGNDGPRRKEAALLTATADDLWPHRRVPRPKYRNRPHRIFADS